MRLSKSIAVAILAVTALSACGYVPKADTGHHEWFNPKGEKVSGDKPDKCLVEDATRFEDVPAPPPGSVGDPATAGWSWARVEVTVRALRASLPGQPMEWQYCVPVSIHINATVDGMPMPLVDAPLDASGALNPAQEAMALPWDGLRNTPVGWIADIGWDAAQRPNPVVNLDAHAKYEEAIDGNAAAREQGEVIALACSIKMNGVSVYSFMSADIQAPQANNPAIKNAGTGPYVRCNPGPFAAQPVR